MARGFKSCVLSVRIRVSDQFESRNTPEYIQTDLHRQNPLAGLLLIISRMFKIRNRPNYKRFTWSSGSLPFANLIRTGTQNAAETPAGAPAPADPAPAAPAPAAAAPSIQVPIASPTIIIDNFDGHASPKDAPVKPPAGMLRVVNPDPDSPEQSYHTPPESKGKEPTGATPVLKPGQEIVNQDGQPINTGKQPQYEYSESMYSEHTSDGEPLVRVPAKKDDAASAGKAGEDANKQAEKYADANKETYQPDGSTPGFQERHPSEEYVGFEALRPQIMHLLTQGLWKGRPDSDFVVTKLRGGSYNRVVAVHVKEPSPTPIKPTAIKDKRKSLDIMKQAYTNVRNRLSGADLDKYAKFATTYASGDFILRIPRLYRSPSSKYDFAADSIMHTFVDCIGIQCPKIIHYEEKGGIVPWPFLLQEKIEGDALSNLYPTMTHRQKVQIASQIGTICKQMVKQKFQTYGTLSFVGPLQEDDKDGMKREVKYDQHGWLDANYSRKHPVSNVIEQSLFYTYHKYENEFKWNGLSWKDLAGMLYSLGRRGLFDKQGYYFTHNDFFPRNIMAAIDANGDAKVTSVLDWDMADFQPLIMACRSPSWLWQWYTYAYLAGEEDCVDVLAGHIPTSPEDRQIKRAFDQAAGQEYCDIAYHRDAYAARKLCLWAYMGWDNRMGRRAWFKWAPWFVKHWREFPDRVRTEGFPVDTHGGIFNPMVFRTKALVLPRLRGLGLGLM